MQYWWVMVIIGVVIVLGYAALMNTTPQKGEEDDGDRDV